jgi:hypothetical protein
MFLQEHIFIHSKEHHGLTAKSAVAAARDASLASWSEEKDPCLSPQASVMSRKQKRRRV